MSKDKLADKFGITPINETEVVEIHGSDVIDVNVNKKIEEDFEEVQAYIKEMMLLGNDAVKEMLELAKTSQSPRSFEVVAMLLKTNKELAETLLQNHVTAEKVKETKREQIPRNVTNNNVFVGNMKELLDTLKQNKNNDK